MWKVTGNRLTNKGNEWQSTQKWNLKANGELFYLENISTNKVLTIVNDNSVHDEILNQNLPNQLWKKGPTNNEGYFTLVSPDSDGFMSAISENAIGIKGTQVDITINWPT